MNDEDQDSFRSVLVASPSPLTFPRYVAFRRLAHDLGLTLAAFSWTTMMGVWAVADFEDGIQWSLGLAVVAWCGATVSDWTKD